MNRNIRFVGQHFEEFYDKQTISVHLIEEMLAVEENPKNPTP